MRPNDAETENELTQLRSALRAAAHSRLDSGWRDLAARCVSAGLPRQEKMEGDSIAKFVQRSVDAVANAELRAAATRFLSVYPFDGASPQLFALGEALYASEGRIGLSKRVRDDLARALGRADLLAAPEAFERLILSLFLVNQFSGFGGGLLEELRDQFIQSGAWSVETLFEKLKAFEVTERRFATFIEGLLTGDVQRSESSIRKLAEKLAPHLRSAGLELREAEAVSGYPSFRLVPQGGNPGRAKNLIFASKSKPDIRFRDAVNNDIEIVGDSDAVLVFDSPIPEQGLLWRDLQAWYAEAYNCADAKETKEKLFRRLRASLPDSSPPARLLFEQYYKRLGAHTPGLPALLPEVWLHWDPRTVRERGTQALLRFRMDFLLLFPGNVRVVIEVDGAQHYADKLGVADPRRYAKMVEADRDLKLAGYEVFRFGGAELQHGREEMIDDFFARLFRRYDVQPR